MYKIEDSYHLLIVNTVRFLDGFFNVLYAPNSPRYKFVGMRGWRLESPDQEEVTSVLNTASNTVVADIQELPPTAQTLHWVAPSSYLGDRVSD